MGDKEQEKNNRFKTLAIVFGMGIVLMLAVSWYATQKVAELCGYSELLGFNIFHIYLPWHYFIWRNTPELAQVIPQILQAQEKWFYLAAVSLIPIGFMVQKSLNVNVSHGSASWAQLEDIDDSGLGLYEEKTEKTKLFGLIPWTKKIKIPKESGVVVGGNPYNGRIMLHDGPEHILLMAPTRSGKGINTIIPTGIVWKHSIFFLDVKQELWNATASYRRETLKQKVMKFEPLCPDGSTARWNPLAEIDFQTTREINDISTIVEIMVRPDGKKSGGEEFWPDSAAALLKGVILHLLYSHYQEGKPLPCPTDIMSFLSSPDKTTTELFKGMKEYPHISVEEFMSDHNVLYEIYGEYIRDWRLFNRELGKCHLPNVHSIAEIKEAIKKYRAKEGKDVPWRDPPWSSLLSHPKVAESAANMLNGAEQTRASIMQTAQTALALYQNPVVQRNTAVSDFTIRDLLNPSQAMSLYLCMATDDVQTLKPLCRLFVNTILSKLIRDMKFGPDVNPKGAGKQRLLLMLDEFPQLGNMSKIELALAVCAGYGIKMCIVSQDVNQLAKEYTKDNSIASNCHVHIYFTPNLDNGGATAKAISESLGKQTISTVTHSSGNNGWFSGSDSTSVTGRDLMTPDEVSRLPWTEEIVFVAGHKPIRGNKLKYFEIPYFQERVPLCKECKKYSLPTFSDTFTKVESFDDLFKVHEAEKVDLEKRISAVKEEKAHMMLDSARNEKLKADQAVAEAKEKLEALKKKLNVESMGKEARRQLAVAESQLSIAENASGLAKAHIDIYDARLQLITLERMITQIQAEKNESTLADTFMTADLKLQQAQKEYSEAKKNLAEALKTEEQVQKTVSADNRQIKARINLMAALDQLEGKQKDAETIFREAEERRDSGDLRDKADLSKKESSAKTMLDIATAAKESAEREFFEAKAAYKAVLDALSEAHNESTEPTSVNQEQSEPHDKVSSPEADASIEATAESPAETDNTEDFEEFDEDWEAKVWGTDPADEEDEEEIETIPFESEDKEDNNGSNDVNTGKTNDNRELSIIENNQYGDPVDGDRQETSSEGARRSGEEPGEKIEADSSSDDEDSDDGQGRVRYIHEVPVLGNPAAMSSDHLPEVLKPLRITFAGDPVCFASGAKRSSMDNHSWPFVRAIQRAQRQKAMEIHRQQFPASHGQGRI